MASRGAAPAASYAVTALAGALILLAGVLAALLQALLALATLPLLLRHGEGMQRFHHLQSLVFRGVNGLICCGLNPLWCMEVHWLGDEPGPPRGGQGSVIFCNHRSNADAWFSAMALSRGCIEGRYIYKSSLKHVPLVGWCMRLAGDLDVKAGDKEQIPAMLERAKEALGHGYNVVVFPEGTRSPSGILQEFKPGFFKICAELGCPAVPMCMLGTERAWPLNGLRMGRATVQAAVGEPLYAAGPGGAQALLVAMEERIREMARELLGEPADSEGGLEVDVEQLDPLVTGKPYPWWRAPPELEGLGAQEQVKLLRAGGTHRRGAGIL